MKRVFAAVLIAAALVVIEGGCVRAAHAADDVARLIQQLHDPDVQHRRDAARELSKITPLPPAAIETMAGLLEQWAQDPLIEDIAETALCDAGGSAIPAATRLARSTDRYISPKGIGLLGCIAKKDKDAWPILIDIYKQNPAGDTIRDLAAVGPPVLPIMFDALKGKDPTMRAGAMMTIEGMVGNAKTFSAESAARNHIGIIAPKDLVPIEPELVAALQNADPKIRIEAAIALNYVEPTDDRALPIFISLITVRDVRFIGAAISGLNAMGSVAKPAVPALEHALATDEDPTIRWDVAKALVQIEGQAACTPLEKAIVKDEPTWRTNQIRTTIGINPPCPRIIPTLIATLRDEDDPGSEAVTALSRMGSAAVPALAAALKSSNLYVRQNSAAALAGMKPLPPDAVRALQFALKDKNSEVRDSAIDALRTIGGAPQQAAEAADKRHEPADDDNAEPDTRLHSRKQIIARIPADAEFMYPLNLVHIVPITKGAAADAGLFVTIHAGKDRPDRLVFWRKVGDDQYQQDKIMSSEEEYVGLGYHFEVPFTFHATYQRISDTGIVQQSGFFVDVPVTGWRVNEDYVFVVENDHVVPVVIDSPYGGPAGGNDFHGGKLEFDENLYNKDDATCCPTGGKITGTYKIIEDARQKPAVWKIVVATTKKTPPVKGGGD